MKHKWCAMKHHSGRFYAQANVKRDGRWTRVLLHRFILGAESPPVVDPKDRDKALAVEDCGDAVTYHMPNGHSVTFACDGNTIHRTEAMP
jgi:hypothetical protein